MNDGLIPRRYAKALLKLASEKGVARETYEQMCALTNSFREYPELKEVVENPFQSVADKKALLLTAAGRTAVSDALFSDFLTLLVENNRLGMIDMIALAYAAIYREENNIHVVKVTTAAELPAESLARLRALVEQHLGGADMEFSSAVDPSLIGGFTVAVDNERLDASVSNQLNELRLNLLSKQKV